MGGRGIYISYLIGCLFMGAMALFTGYRLSGATVSPSSFIQQLFSDGTLIWLAISTVNLFVLLLLALCKANLRKPLTAASFIVIGFLLSVAVSWYVVKGAAVAA